MVFFRPAPWSRPCAEARRGFDAYWTPLFGDGSFAAQLCEAGASSGAGNTCHGGGWLEKGWECRGGEMDFKWWKMVGNEVLYLF